MLLEFHSSLRAQGVQYTQSGLDHRVLLVDVAGGAAQEKPTTLLHCHRVHVLSEVQRADGVEGGVHVHRGLHLGVVQQQQRGGVDGGRGRQREGEEVEKEGNVGEVREQPSLAGREGLEVLAVKSHQRGHLFRLLLETLCEGVVHARVTGTLLVYGANERRRHADAVVPEHCLFLTPILETDMLGGEKVLLEETERRLEDLRRWGMAHEEDDHVKARNQVRVDRIRLKQLSHDPIPHSIRWHLLQNVLAVLLHQWNAFRGKEMKESAKRRQIRGAQESGESLSVFDEGKVLDEQCRHFCG